MEAITVGLDIAKSVFQVHGVDETGEVVVRKRLRRSQMIPFFERLEPCVIGMEACPTSHHWSRALQALGHAVRLMPASYVKAYVKRNKNDAADAAGVRFHLSEVKGPVMDRLEHSDFFEHLTGQVFLTQYAALNTLDPDTTASADRAHTVAQEATA